jgi:hypothetical protein
MLQLNLDDLIELRGIIKKHFPNNKVVLKVYNSPEDGELEAIVGIQVSVGDGVEETVMMLDKFDEEMFNNQNLEESLDFVCVTTKYV